jgi:DNA repair exonuclease SbcCD nuclease subunit
MEPIKFIHIADTHLGKRQYNLNERYIDYFHAFNWILDLSIKEEVDFLLISGDIFDKKNINPSVLSQLFYIIRDFKSMCKEILNRDIPLICIEGNHDNPIYTTHSWMSFLADLDLIILLSGNYNKDEKKVEFENYSFNTHRGGFYQIKDAYIYGLPYYGSFTSHLFPAIDEAIPKNDGFNILMMHFGIEGEDKLKPGIVVSTPLKNLHEKVDYMALGHYHKQYVYPKTDPWIYNPGSLEITDSTGFKPDFSHGAFLVDITGKKYYERNITPLIAENGNSDGSYIPNRKFFRVSDIDISSSQNFDKAIELILDKIKKHGVTLLESDTALAKNDLNCPIIILSIKGEIGYSRLDIDITKLRSEIKNKFNILDVRINFQNLFSKIDEIGISDDSMTIEEIEKEILAAIIEENQTLSPLKNELLNLMNDLKVSLLQNKPNYSILQEQISEWCMLNVDGYQKPRRISKIEKSEMKVKTEIIDFDKKTSKHKVTQEEIKEKIKRLKTSKSEIGKDDDLEFELFGEFDFDEHIDDGSDEEEEK